MTRKVVVNLFFGLERVVHKRVDRGHWAVNIGELDLTCCAVFWRKLVVFEIPGRVFLPHEPRCYQRATQTVSTPPSSGGAMSGVAFDRFIESYHVCGE
jgi:hypothetical protein